jgi:H/ACA ribonucleoprotein complex subunit 4
VKREVVTRIEAESDSRYGCPPSQRPMGQHLKLGVINLDKHRGPTSHDVAATVRKMMSLSLVGHGGTLEIYGEIPPSPACCP